MTEVEKGAEDLSALIDRFLQAHPLERRDRALVTELVYGALRHRGRLDWTIDRFSKVSLHLSVRNLLRLGLYQILFLDKIPPSAAVNEAVELAKELEGPAAGRLVNGLLRNILRKKEGIIFPDQKIDPVGFISISTSHPEWMVRRWIGRWGFDQTEKLCRFNNEIPLTTLRVNRFKSDRDTLAKQLEQEGGKVEAVPFSPVGLHVKGLSIGSLASYREGALYIQDEGAQLISYLVDPKPREKVLDLCAAPGGKATHLAELMEGKGEVTATDIDSDRLKLLEENLSRLQTPGMAIEPIETALGARRKYDRILIDAPCSALGILRRIPEGKWRKKESIIASYAKTQREILEQALPHLKEGGRLIYATCSTEREENEVVVEQFTAAHPEMKIEDPSASLPPGSEKYLNEKSYFTTLFNSDKMDQFFAVRWIKTRAQA